MRWTHPRFSHHQLKMVDVIERHRAYRDSSESEQQRERQQHERAAAVGGKRVEGGASRARLCQPPAKWRVPGHLRWLMWRRSQARQKEAERKQQQRSEKRRYEE